MTVQEAIADSAYVRLLEDVNAQLGLWSSHSGVMITTLGVLVGVGGVMAAVLLWRQGSEFKRLIDDSLARHEKVLDGVVAKYETVLSETVTKWKGTLDEAIKEIGAEAQKTPGEPTGSVLRALKLLQEERDRLDETRPMGKAAAGWIAALQSVPIECLHCGQAFLVGHSTWPPKCPSCGRVHAGVGGPRPTAD